MFENGCFLRRQKRFKCPRMETQRRNSRSSTSGGSYVDGTPSGDTETVPDEAPPRQNTPSIKREDQQDDPQKTFIPPPEHPFPLRTIRSTTERNVSLLQAMASVDSYSSFPLTHSSGDVFRNPDYGGGLLPQQHCFNDPRGFALLQCHQLHQRQPHPSIAESSKPGYSTSSGPEVLMPAFPVYDALQRYHGDTVQQRRVADELSYQNPSQRFYPAVYRQLQQPFRRHPASDSDPFLAVDSIPTVPSFSPYHAVQASCHDDQRHQFRSSISTSGSGLRPSSHLQPQSVSQSPSMTDVTDDIQRQNLISLSSSASGTHDGYHALSILSDVQHGFPL